MGDTDLTGERREYSGLATVVIYEGNTGSGKELVRLEGVVVKAAGDEEIEWTWDDADVGSYEITIEVLDETGEPMADREWSADEGIFVIVDNATGEHIGIQIIVETEDA